MLFSRSAASASLALVALQIGSTQAQSAGPLVLKGCFTNAKGLTFDNTYQYQSQGWCQTQCLKKQKPVMGLTGGGDCWCGDEIPPQSAKTDDFKCSHQCNGFTQSCGGPLGTFGVYSTGLNPNPQQVQDDNPPVLGGISSDSSSASTATSTEQSATTTTASPSETTVPPTVVTVGGGTSVVTIPGSTVTIPPSQQASASVPRPTSTRDDDGPSTGAKVGIALGVIGGVAAIAGIIAAVFIMKKKKNEAIVNRHRRNTSNNPFANDGSVDGTRNGSMSDSRLDPTMVERERRLSNGSVFADNEDYSRRILKVTNPTDR